MYDPAIPWQALEKHELETMALMKDLGFTDDKGRMRRFNGRTFYPKYNELGHTTIDVNQCKCWRKVTR